MSKRAVAFFSIPLKLFLTQDLHLNSCSIAEAIDEMKRNGASSVHPVSLGILHARKLGLA